MVVEEVIVTLSGGAPWGFRLQGGVEHQKPLQVAKVRKRSKACRAGLREADELMSINDKPCSSLSHAQAMNLIDSSPGTLNIRVKRTPAAFQSVVLVARAPSPRIDKEYRAALKAMSPTQTHHAPVREVHRSRSSMTSGLTSPPGSEAYYGETDSDADVAGYERQRRQKRRSPSNSTPGKPMGRASPEGGETSEMSGYDSAPDAQVAPRLLDGNGARVGCLPGVARKEVIFKPPAPGMWSSQTSTETSSIISSAEDQAPRDVGPEEEMDFGEPANVPLVSPQRAKEALMLGSRNQLVPMVGPVDKPIDEELTTTYMEKAKQAKLNRGDTQQDKQVKEAKSKCRTIASLLTDAPNPHSKGVLMFKKRRQRSKKYTLTSFGSVDEDRCQDSQEEDGIFQGSESEFDEEGFSGVPDPTWDSDYFDKLEKRATAGTEGRENEENDARSPGLSDTAGKGAQLFEQQRKRVAEHTKKVEVALPQSSSQPDGQEQTQLYQVHQQMQAKVEPNLQIQQVLPLGPTPTQVMIPRAPIADEAHRMINGDVSYTAVSTVNMVMSPSQVAPKPVNNSMQPDETPLSEVSASNVQNRTARPFTPGFISIRAATAPVAFRPTVTKRSQRPASTAVVAPPPMPTNYEQPINTTLSSLHQPPIPPPLRSQPYAMPQNSTALVPEATVTFHPPALSTPAETIYSSPPVSGAQKAQFSTMNMIPMPPPLQATLGPAPIAHPPQVSGSVNTAVAAPLPQEPVLQALPQFSTPPAAQTLAANQTDAGAPNTVAGRTGILLEARRRGGKPKPMFVIPEVKKNSPNPDLLSMVQNLDDRSIRFKQPPAEVYYDGEEEMRNDEAGMGRMPPPVAPKPRITHETPQALQAGGKGAELFAKRQSRMGMYVVDTPPEISSQSNVALENQTNLLGSSISSQWKYSPNVRAPPPIGYNPLLAPTIPTGPQRDVNKPDNKGKGTSQREGIKALDFMRRQPYQLNAAMFNYGGSTANLSAMPSYQAQQSNCGTMVGSSLTTPRQIPVKTARVYEIKRFSTPTPMSAPTLTPKVIAPRSATTLGERLTHSGMASPPIATFPQMAETVHMPNTMPHPSQTVKLPSLPKFSAPPIPNAVPHAVPTPYTPVSFSSGLHAAKQFQSAPELSILASLPPLKNNPVQAPKPHFVATKGGVQPRVWRPGAI